MTTLAIKNFAHLAEVKLEFGDLTVLVGAQGTGKSLALQWLKTAIDGKQIVAQLRDAGQDAPDPTKLIDLIFGVGMGSSWTNHTSVTLDAATLGPKTIGRRGTGEEKCFSSRRIARCSSATAGPRRSRN